MVLRCADDEEDRPRRRPPLEPHKSVRSYTGRRPVLLFGERPDSDIFVGLEGGWPGCIAGLIGDKGQVVALNVIEHQGRLSHVLVVGAAGDNEACLIGRGCGAGEPGARIDLLRLGAGSHQCVGDR